MIWHTYRDLSPMFLHPSHEGMTPRGISRRLMNWRVIFLKLSGSCLYKTTFLFWALAMLLDMYSSHGEGALDALSFNIVLL